MDARAPKRQRDASPGRARKRLRIEADVRRSLWAPAPPERARRARVRTRMCSARCSGVRPTVALSLLAPLTPAENERLQKQLACLQAQIAAKDKFIVEAVMRVVYLDRRVTAVEAQQREACRPGPIVDLPDEMIYLIFARLTLSDILACELVCARWAVSVRKWLQCVNLTQHHGRVNECACVLPARPAHCAQRCSAASSSTLT